MSELREPFPDVSKWSDTDLSNYVRKTLTESFGGRVDYDPVYSDLYSLDFVINRLEGIHALVNLGVRTTFSIENLSRQEAFLEAAKKGVVHKSVYLEFDRRNLNQGALIVAYAAFLAFLFDNRYRELKAIGLRIFEDCTYHFFSLEENIRRLRRERHEQTNEYDRQVGGDIIAYFTDKGFGFIEDESAQKFFFHIANVVDEDLRIQLPSYNQGDIIPVEFYYGGSDGKKYPKAVNVTLGRSAAIRPDLAPESSGNLDEEL
ncbi:MAG: cold shock domain-containing protein [Bradymonadales bacterium]|nr:cold shock domain-containing protein [Bradymonadales bacterium]